MKRAIAVGLSLLAFSGLASGADLMEVFQDALENDPQIREAEATRRAALEARPQAWANLLPQISASGSKTYGESDSNIQLVQELPTGDFLQFQRGGPGEPESTRWSVDLRQSLFSWENWMALRRSSAEVAQAEANYRAAQQDLLLRVAQRYFDVLAAQDAVEAETAAQEAIQRQLEQAEKRFEVGLIAITDVQDARAARDTANASVIAAKRQLATAQELLREITNKTYDRLEKPGTDMPLKAPEPASPEAWVQAAMEQNLALISSRLAADIARADARAAYGGHLPTIDLVVSKSHFKENDVQTFEPNENRPNSVSFPTLTETDDESIGIQVTLPIFSGGRTQSQVRQNQYRWLAAKERVTRVSRETERLARDSYLGVMSEIARVNALRQALESSQTSLKATEAGYEVGTRTAVDVLAARQALVRAQTDFARSRYDYLLNVIRLRQAAGTLDPEVIAELNQLLDVSAPLPPTTP